MQQLIEDTIKEIKAQDFETQKEWNRYAVRHGFLSAETMIYLTNKNYQQIRNR